MVRAFNIITYTWLRYLNCRNKNFLGKSFSRQLGSFCNPESTTENREEKKV